MLYPFELSSVLYLKLPVEINDEIELPLILPEYKVAIPFVPVEIEPNVYLISPPVEVPADALFPAFKVIAFAVVSCVWILFEIVISEDLVAIFIIPVAVIPKILCIESIAKLILSFKRDNDFTPFAASFAILLPLVAKKE